MKYIPYFVGFLLFLAMNTTTVNAQFLNLPNPSPKATVSQTVGITDVEVTYYRPAVKEREIWGKLVPYKATWRAGANDNTVISFSKAVKIEGKDLAAGTYGFHIIPLENEATLIFSNNSTSWGSFSYNEKEDALRVNIKTAKSKQFYERLTFEFSDLTANTATCALHWENKSFPFSIEASTHEVVLAKVRDDLRNRPGFTWVAYNQAANYCLQNDVNHKEAIGWASRSVFMNPNAANIMTKARLAGKMKGEGDETKEQKVLFLALEADLGAFPVTWKEYNAAANFAVKKEKYDKALAWSEKAVNMSPNMTSMMTKSTIYDKKGDAKMAMKVKKDAIARGSNAELNTYGYQLLFSGKTKEAVEVFEANTDKHPTDPNAWDSLGEGYFNNNQQDMAVKAFKKSLSLNPPANVRANSMKFLGQMGVEVDNRKMDDIKP